MKIFETFRDKVLNESLVKSENKNTPTFDKLNQFDTHGDFESDDYRIVRYAYDDKGSNFLALLDLKNQKVLSTSLTGSTEIKKFNKLSETEIINKNAAESERIANDLIAFVNNRKYNKDIIELEVTNNSIFNYYFVSPANKKTMSLLENDIKKAADFNNVDIEILENNHKEGLLSVRVYAELNKQHIGIFETKQLMKILIEEVEGIKITKNGQ